MANEVRVRATVDDKVSGPLDRIKDKFEVLGKKGAGASLLGNLGAMGVAKGLSLVEEGLGAVVDQAFKSIEAASSLNEAMSKSQAVFGDLSDEMDAWASTASASFGQSKRSALEAAGTYGNLFQAFGIGQQKAADMSRTLVELASDLASFNNTSVDEAILALRSGLSGETEPLKRFGVAINDVRLKEEAMRLGLIKTTSGVLPQAIKTQAAYSLILKDTALAQGDFDRTSDGLANTQKSLTAAIEDAQASIGEQLLPVMLELANFAKDEVVPAIVGIADAAKQLGPVFDALGLAVIAVVQGPTAAATEAARRMAEETAEAVEDAASSYTAYENKRGEWASAAGKLADELPDALDAAADNAVAIVSRTPQDLADALRDGRDKWEAAIDLFNDDWDSKLSTAAEVARIKGHLAGEKLTRGLKSADPILRAQAIATRDALLDRLHELEGGTYDIGKGTMVNYIQGMTSQLLAIQSVAEEAAAKVTANLRVRSPAKEGPLSEGGGPEGYGKRLGELYAKGVSDSLPKVGASAADLAGAMVGGAGIAPTIGGSGSAPMELHVHLHTDGGVLTPAQGQAIAREVGPFLMDYIARRG